MWCSVPGVVTCNTGKRAVFFSPLVKWSPLEAVFITGSNGDNNTTRSSDVTFAGSNHTECCKQLCMSEIKFMRQST